LLGIQLLFKREIASNMSSCEIETFNSISSKEQIEARLILPRVRNWFRQIKIWLELRPQTELILNSFKKKKNNLNSRRASGKKQQRDLFKLRVYRKQRKQLG
jgi:hypothetical protein